MRSGDVMGRTNPPLMVSRAVGFGTLQWSFAASQRDDECGFPCARSRRSVPLRYRLNIGALFLFGYIDHSRGG
ncbi:hypothetical protein A9Q95_02165 [Rhodobacterales bacterium 59_46_T64]|nr:hypothetical protein A9Q95_02165 [Rhodobacterales bacterium 59_46_T64]